MAEQGKPLNAQVFSEIYEKLFKEYNGDSLVFDEEVKYGWARILISIARFTYTNMQLDLHLPFKSLINY